MYAAVDIGGTKTLLAALDDNGVILQKIRFETPQDYDLFILALKRASKDLEYKDFKAAGVGMPGKVDHVHGRGVWFGNLHEWHNVPLHDDIEKVLSCPVVIENDAKMAALSEAMMVKKEFSRVLYVTVSTGIGYGLVVNQHIDENVGDYGGHALLVEHRGKLVSWESFASGHAITERYGKMAKDIHDAETWHKIVRDLVPGLLELIAIAEPEVIIFGGGVGTYFDRWGKLLADEIDKYKTPLVQVPELRGAQRPEEAVLFGCYDLAKEVFGALAR